MSISDVIKTKFIEEFTAISAGGMALSLLLTVGCGSQNASSSAPAASSGSASSGSSTIFSVL